MGTHQGRGWCIPGHYDEYMSECLFRRWRFDTQVYWYWRRSWGITGGSGALRIIWGKPIYMSYGDTNST